MLAAWLDNDGDGCVDNPTVLTKLTEKVDLGGTVKVQAAIVVSETASYDKLNAAGYFTKAPQYNNETFPNCSGPAATSRCADATLEEVLHMITDVGFAKAFPTTFATSNTSNSLLTQALDVARGGKFNTIPSPYPSNATYTYNDTSCKYPCQATEYIYFGVCTYVGAMVGRCVNKDVTNHPYGVKLEFKLCTKELLKNDTKLTAIIEVFIS